MTKYSPHHRAFWHGLPLLLWCALFGLGTAQEPTPDLKTTDLSLFARSNLVAWCIVPFDAAQRGPTARAEMLRELGLRRMAYDWRAEHIPTFDAEIAAMREHDVEITAWWTMPDGLDGNSRAILDVCERNNLKTQFWVLIGEPLPGSTDQVAKVSAGANQLRPFAEAAHRIGCQVALYNHGGWFGEPENQIAILKELDLPNVGIVYNLHHGHAHIGRFTELFRTMQPHLLALNLNGMVDQGDARGHKILHLAEGDRELEMLRIIAKSGWKGDVGILDHRPETDSKITLQRNLDGMDWLLKELQEPGSGGKRPFTVPAPPPTPTQPTSTGVQKGADGTNANSVSVSDSEPDSGRDSVQGLTLKSGVHLDPFWAVEDANERESLPLLTRIPAATPESLTPANELKVEGNHRLWHRSHGDAHGTRYSALTEIDRSNVHTLRPAWTYHSGDGTGNIQCNPIVAEGLLFGPTVGESLVALDASTGVEKWRFRPGGRPAHRGLLYWPGDESHPARILFNAGDHLYALQPQTGKPVPGFGENGRVHTGAVVVAGAVFQHVLVLPGFHRDVFGHDVRTGEKLWHFNTIPAPGEYGHETWDKPTTGANCWGGMAMDSHRGIAYLATGSPKPNFTGMHHRGDNLYANCVVALDALTGERVWHFQEIRHDIWDLDIPAPPNLLSVERHGKKVDALAQVTKLGNTLLLDRVTGEPLYDVPLRRAPSSKLPGERTAAYQPDIQTPTPFARQVFSLDDVTTRTESARDFVLAQVQRANFGWFEPFEDGVPTVLYGIHGGAEWTGSAVDPVRGILYVSSNEVPWIITVHRTDDIPRPPGHPITRGEVIYQESCATCHGAHREGVGVSPPLQGLRHRSNDSQVLELLTSGRNLMPVAPAMTQEDRQALLDFLFLRDRPQPEPGHVAPPQYTHDGYRKLLDDEGYPGCRPPWGTLNALDLNTGKMLWKIPLGQHEELAAQGLPDTGTENFGGPIVTAGGIVFCAGTRDEKIRAFDAESGKELWSWKLPWGGYAPPACYEIDGRQYLVIAATGGGKLGGPMGDAYIAFALPE